MGALSYEALRFRLTHPLQLENGVIIPPCNIKILAETEGAGPLTITRRDHVRRYIAWVRTDLSSILPTEWFQPESVHYEPAK